MASPCCKRAVSIWLKFCRGIPFSATATVVGRKTYHFSFTCGRGQFLQIWKGNLLFWSSTCGKGQDRLGLRRSLQTHLRSPKQRSPSSVPANGFSNVRKIFLPCPKIPTGECPARWESWTSAGRSRRLPRRAPRGSTMKDKGKMLGCGFMSFINSLHLTADQKTNK